MKSTLLRWLSPQDLSRVSQLQLFARGVVEGVSGGMHRSRHIGASIEFKEHRPYVAGDEIRSIDWKLFGKTDRLYIRQYEDETNLRCTIVLDQSGSMRYAGTRANGLSKHEYSVKLAACFAYLLIAQQDAVGLALFDTAIRGYIPPKSRPNHLQVLFETIAASKPGGETDIGLVLQDMLHRCKRRGVVIVISDCFGDCDRLIQSLALLRSNYQEVILVQVMDDDECDFPFQQRTMFRSLEIESEQMLVDPTQLRATYLKNWDAFQERLTSGCQQKGIDLLSARTTDSHTELVSRYLAKRRGSA